MGASIAEVRTNPDHLDLEAALTAMVIAIGAQLGVNFVFVDEPERRRLIRNICNRVYEGLLILRLRKEPGGKRFDDYLMQQIEAAGLPVEDVYLGGFDVLATAVELGAIDFTVDQGLTTAEGMALIAASVNGARTNALDPAKEWDETAAEAQLAFLLDLAPGWKPPVVRTSFRSLLAS
jgi:hypothetical protein